MTLSQTALRAIIHYNTESGEFLWKIRKRGIKNLKAGWSGKGSGKSSYRYIRIDGVLYPAHRLAWLYVTGEFPYLVDHIDRDGLNNRFNNLRVASKSTNAINSGNRVDNVSGIKGVSWDSTRGKWSASIRCRGKDYRLGRFDVFEKAAKVRAEKELELFGEFASIPEALR